MTCQDRKKRMSDIGRGDGTEHVAYLYGLEFFWGINRVEQYPISLEDW